MCSHFVFKVSAFNLTTVSSRAFFFHNVFKTASFNLWLMCLCISVCVCIYFPSSLVSCNRIPQ